MSGPAERLRAPANHGAEPGRVALATATLILCLAALVILTLARGRIAERVRSPLFAKLGDADRVAYYLVEPDAGPSFRIGPGDRSLKLITHLLLPATTPYDPEQEFAYGVLVIVRALSGEELWRHRLDIRTRQSKSGGDRFGWRHENAFMLDDERQLTDDRLTRVRLPPATGDRLIELRLIPTSPAIEVAGLARVYVRRPRRIDDRTLRELALAPAAARELVDHLTWRDWTQLSDDERRVKLSQIWERLAAEGEPGRDYRTLTIYATGFRLPRGSSHDVRRLEVDRWRSVAINVIGPAELELRSFGDPSLARALEISRRGLDGSSFAYPRHGARVRPLTIPEGVHTLFIESELRVEIELEVVDAAVERVWLIESERPLRQNEHGNEVLEPDRRRIEIVRIGAQWSEPPRYRVAGPEDAISRIFRFDVRVAAHIASAWWRERGPTPTLDICFLDETGAELDCDRWTGRPTIGSRFEGLREGGVPTAGGTISPERWYVVSEPQSFRVIAPARAASVELRDPEGGLDQRLIVRGHGFWPEVRTVVAEPFSAYESELVRWRYPPLDTRTWFPLRPSNYRALQDRFAVADLFAQVRLEPRGHGRHGHGDWWTGDPDFDDWFDNLRAGEDGWDPGPWVTLEPRGVHRRRSILERLDRRAARRLIHRWDPSLFSALRSDRTMLIDFSASGPEPPQLHWQVDPSLLGRTVSISIDGQPNQPVEREASPHGGRRPSTGGFPGREDSTHLLRATRGRWRLPALSGRHEIELELDAGDSRWAMWIDRPLLRGSSSISRRRSIHDLTTELVFPLHKPGVDPLIVNVVVYLPRRRPSAELELSVDEGDPERHSGVFARVSVPARRYAIDTHSARDHGDRIVDERLATRVVDLESRPGAPLDVVTLQITLGEDVIAGPHELRVKLLDGGRIWVRAFHRGVADRRRPATSWTAAPEEDR